MNAWMWSVWLALLSLDCANTDTIRRVPPNKRTTAGAQAPRDAGQLDAERGAAGRAGSNSRDAAVDEDDAGPRRSPPPEKPAVTPQAGQGGASAGAAGYAGAAPVAGSPGAETPPDAATALNRDADLTGSVWVDSLPRDYGVEAFSVTGTPWRTITANLDQLTPSADGTRYAYVSNDDARDTSEIGLVNAVTLDTLSRMQVPGHAYFPRPALHDPQLVIVSLRSATETSTLVDYVFFNVPQATEVARVAGIGALNWLPDGRYLRITSTGEIYLGELTGVEVPNGTLALPEGTTAGFFAVNQQGTRIAIRVIKASSQGADRDVYVANIDGSQFERFTKTTLTSYAFFSPDGRYLLFNYDPDLRCGAHSELTGCLHSDCRIYYAPADRRGIVINGGPEDPSRLGAIGSSGKRSDVPCDPIGWVAGP